MLSRSCLRLLLERNFLAFCCFLLSALFCSCYVLLNPFQLSQKRLPSCHTYFSGASRSAERDRRNPHAHLISASQLPSCLFTQQDSLFSIIRHVVIQKLRNVKQRVHRTNTYECSEIRDLHNVSL